MESEERLSNLLATALGGEVLDLLQDKAISEIRLNADGTLWAHRLGEGKFQCNAYISPANAQRAIYAVAYGVNEVCDEKKLNPYFEQEFFFKLQNSNSLIVFKI